MTRKRIVLIALAAMTLLLMIGTSVTAAPYGSRLMKSGLFGGDVAELQRRLNALGYGVGQADGVFGTRTRQGLVQFQTAYGLVPDGVAGKWTVQALDRAFTWKHGFSHTVARGETLWTITQRYGTTVDAVVWLNRLADTMLYPGQELRIPGDAKNRPTVNPPGGSQPAGQAPTVQPPNPTAPAPGTLPPGGNLGPQPLPLPPISGVVGLTGAAESGATGAGIGVATNPQPARPATPPAAQIPTPGWRHMVLGYYAEDWNGDLRSLNSLKGAAGRVHLVVNFNLLIDGQGNITTRDYPDLSAEARRQGVKVHGLVHNLNGPNFDSGVARSVLSNPANRARAIANMVKVAEEKGLAGINIDIENVPPDQRDNYSALIRELAAALKPRGLGLTLSIPAKTFDDRTSSWSGAFDYKELGKHADYIVPMAYDQTLPGFPAGPVAAVDWVEKVAVFAASQIPREKVLLGVAAYGYDWKRGTTEGRGLSVPQAVKLAETHGATIQWDDRAKVPFFTYTRDGVERIVYYEDARSLGHKLDLVRKHQLGGIGIWRMGLEDASIWPVIEQKLK